MNRHVRGLGINGEQVFHGEEIAPDDWRAVDIDRPRGLARYDREHLITRLADLIGEGHLYQLVGGVGSTAIYVDIDRAGNTWLNHQYQAPHQYLPELIPPADPPCPCSCHRADCPGCEEAHA